MKPFNFVRVSDNASGIIILLMVVLAPWMLGTTSNNAIQFLNFLGISSGILQITKCVVNLKWVSTEKGKGLKFKSHWSMASVFLGCITLLGYVLCSAFNSAGVLKYTYELSSPIASGVDVEYLSYIEWLPQSYDRERTLRAFWKYLAITMSFFAARDWLKGRSQRGLEFYSGDPSFPTDRMLVFFWVLSISSAVLALVGILQRLDGGQKLLWWFDTSMRGGDAAFGPYPYRSNGAQYLNLVWPITLGIWWVIRRRTVERHYSSHRIGKDPQLLFLACAVLIAAGVVVANSRGGFLVLVGLLLVFVVLGSSSGKRQWRFKVGGLSAIFCGFLLGWWLGGDLILRRFYNEDFSQMSGRNLIYDDATRMAKDFALFGSGAETFAPLYYFYRLKDPVWSAYVHNDYLETLITFGCFGAILIFLIFVSVWLVPFYGNGIPAPREFIGCIAVSMAGIMVHALFDLPFQIYSLHFEFAMLCALLTCLRWQKR